MGVETDKSSEPITKKPSKNPEINLIFRMPTPP
jgi:hypothetical protein